MFSARRPSSPPRSGSKGEEPGMELTVIPGGLRSSPGRGSIPRAGLGSPSLAFAPLRLAGDDSGETRRASLRRDPRGLARFGGVDLLGHLPAAVELEEREVVGE